MRRLALDALGSAKTRGVTYADVRVVESRERSVATKNGKIGRLSSSTSRGVGIRVLAGGCWGFAATDDLSREGLNAAAALAIDIAHSGRHARKKDVELMPEPAYEAEWVSPCRIDPFTIPV